MQFLYCIPGTAPQFQKLLMDNDRHKETFGRVIDKLPLKNAVHLLVTLAQGAQMVYLRAGDLGKGLFCFSFVFVLFNFSISKSCIYLETKQSMNKVPFMTTRATNPWGFITSQEVPLPVSGYLAHRQTFENHAKTVKMNISKNSIAFVK